MCKNRALKFMEDAKSYDISSRSINSDKWAFRKDWMHAHRNYNWNNSPKDGDWVKPEASAYSDNALCSDIAFICDLERIYGWKSTFLGKVADNGFPILGWWDTDEYWYTQNPNPQNHNAIPLFRHYFNDMFESDGRRIAYHEIYNYNTHTWTKASREEFALAEHDYLLMGMSIY